MFRTERNLILINLKVEKFLEGSGRDLQTFEVQVLQVVYANIDGDDSAGAGAGRSPTFNHPKPALRTSVLVDIHECLSYFPRDLPNTHRLTCLHTHLQHPDPLGAGALPKSFNFHRVYIGSCKLSTSGKFATSLVPRSAIVPTATSLSWQVFRRLYLPVLDSTKSNLC